MKLSRETKATGFYNSKAWKDTRRNYKQSVGGLCERCLSQGIIRPAEIVHHKEPLTESNIQNLELSLGWKNLQALCRQCHAEVHDDIYAQRTGRRYRIDNNGKIIIRGDNDGNQDQTINNV